MTTEGYNNSHGAVCPYCGHLNQADDSDGILYDESTCEYDCGECDKYFSVSIYVSHSWRTKKIDKGE